MRSKKFEIYIGLKDKETYEELFSVEDLAQIIVGICKNKNIGFSLTTQLGGYSHNKGYVTETSVRITLIGLNIEEVQKLGDVLKKHVNTDTIMITSEECDCFFK